MRDLAELIRWARGASLPPSVATALVGALLELVELRRAVGEKRLAAAAQRREQADLIKGLREEGLTLKAACAQAGVSPRTIQRRRRGDTVVSPVGAALNSWRVAELPEVRSPWHSQRPEWGKPFR